MAVGSKGRVVSIVLNNEFIKICELTKNGKNVIIHKSVTIPTPERSYTDGVVRDRGALCKVIKVALDDNRITTSDVIFSIASNKIATKEVIIPNVKANKIQNIVMTNASEYFPVNIEEHIIQHTVLEHLVDDGVEKIKVLVMAAPSDLIETFYNLASSIGLHIVSIDYIGNSTSHALKSQIDKSTCMVVQIENDATLVNIFSNNVLELQRTIPYGKSVIVNALMDAFHMKYDPALKKLQSEQIVHEHLDGDEVTESLRYLISNINRIVDFYISRNTNKNIEKAYIIGNATTIKGFNELLTNELRMPLLNITHLNGVILDKKTYVDETTLTSYISNIGALISPVNFVPKEITQSERGKDNSRIAKAIFGFALIVAILITVIPLSQMMSVKSNLDTVRGSNEKIKDVEKVVSDYYVAKDMYVDAEKFHNLTISPNDDLQNFLVQLEDNIPSDVSFKTMQITNEVVDINGVTDSKLTLASLIQQLRGLDCVSSVVVGSESESKDNANVKEITFSLTCNLSTQ